ncbi:MAG: DNA-processing protein DprA [bacterium]|nr:DNA-processing protein DprA [bacterium]
MRQDLQAWLTLYSVPGLGPAAFATLLQHFPTPANVLCASREQLQAVPGIGPGLSRAILENHNNKWAADQIRISASVGIRILTLSDSDYPPYLRQIYAPPPILFTLGNITAFQKPSIALVGSRSFTPYGRDTARRLAEGLSQRGFAIVSGMALGIDAHAHNGALEAGGTTVAVLGSGLDHPYPPENRSLFTRICESGAVVTEFPVGTKPEAHHFPRRNRIISGLCLGVVVIEAGERSGALITARYALEQNREVFAIPGPIHSGRSLGTNRLIRQGAVLVQDPGDILEELPTTTPVLSSAERAPEVDLPEPERSLFTYLLETGPSHIDTIAAQVGFSAARTLSCLLSLELAGLAVQLPGKRFMCKER